MPYRPRELVIRAREAATLLLGTLDRNEMVQRFLDMYAAENRRPGRADQPGHYREQLETIRREAILAMVLRTESALPSQLRVRLVVRSAKTRTGSRAKAKKGKKGAKVRGSKRKTRSSGIDLAIPLLDLFREEFFVAIGQALALPTTMTLYAFIGIAVTSATVVTKSSCSSAAPENSTSRLSVKCRKKVRLVSPARSAISATVVSSYPRSPYRARAASCSRARASGCHLPMRPD